MGWTKDSAPFLLLRMCRGVKEEFFREELHCMTTWLDTFGRLPQSYFIPEVTIWALLVGGAHKELGFSKVKFIWPILNVLE